MTKHARDIQLRWTDIDANGHVKHSSYYDFGAVVRMNFFAGHGLTVDRLKEIGIGPVLFREEAIFKREIKFEDKVSIDTRLLKAAPDYSRWSLQHHIFVGGEKLAAILNVDGAWIDLAARRLATPDETIRRVFDLFGRSDDFETIREGEKSG